MELFTHAIQRALRHTAIGTHFAICTDASGKS